MGALSKEDLYRTLSEELGFKRDEAKSLVETFFEEIRATLEENCEIKLANFGNFNLRNKTARPGRNPKTGEDVIIASRRVVTFKPGPKLKDAVETYRPEADTDE